MCYPGHTVRSGRTLSDRLLSWASLISAAGVPDPEETVHRQKPPCQHLDFVTCKYNLQLVDSFQKNLFPSLGAVEDLVWCDSEVGEDFSDSSGVDAAVRSDVTLAAPVHVHFTHFTHTHRQKQRDLDRAN